MPNKDGSGPEGKGAKTGRQLGNCEEAKPIVGSGRCGRPCGRRAGRGLRRNQDA